eukprot:TRINITY_DN10117_c0_g1_i1.p1 TRINITY_DN10117_c0_g1~~TRINITY_DN10117_c0_g1_i1.p1  ORF type:complete len:281 (-),score=66.20 TRINITY_DN10117_c0_g1_i1:261-1043(-)
MTSSFSSWFSSIGTKIKEVAQQEAAAISKLVAEVDSSLKSTDTPPEAPPQAKPVPPWLDFPSDLDPKIAEDVKSQILGLTKSRRNFLNAPPDDVPFAFDYEANAALAVACLEADPALSNARFYLVPKNIREPKFWRNYFYRVHVIKEAFGLNKKLELDVGVVDSPKSDSLKASSKENKTAAEVHAEEVLKLAREEIEDLSKPTDADRDDESKEKEGWEDDVMKELENYKVSSTDADADGGVEIDDAWEEQMKRELDGTQD